jgi:hypothetical protein
MVISTYLMFLQSAYWVGTNRVLAPVALIFAGVSILRRREAIGGWLLYSYYWIFAVLYISLNDILKHTQVFRPSFGVGSVNHEALVLAVFPRLFATLAALVLAVVLLIRKDWVWVERLRLVLLVHVLIAAFSLWLDVRYFPTTTVPNGGRLIGLFLWLLYFHKSKRVHRVFCTKDWGKTMAEKVMT